MADVFLNSADFVQHTFFTLAAPSIYTWNLKTLTKVSKGKFRKDELHFSKKHLPKVRIL